MRNAQMNRSGLGTGLLLLATILPSTALAQKIPDTRLDTDLPGAGSSSYPDIAASGDSVYVTWQDARDSSFPLLRRKVYFNRSLDGGATWLSSDIRLDRDLGAASSDGPRIAASGDLVAVTWMDGRNGASDIWFNRSLDAGASWLALDLRLDTDLPGASSSRHPRIAALGNSVYVTWADDRNGLADICFNRSLDGGSSWLPADIRLETDLSGAATSRAPQITVLGDSVYVTWADSRNGDFRYGPDDIYFNRSLDGGASWLATDMRLDTDLPAAAHSKFPQIAAFDDAVYVAWGDSRNGAQDIYFNRSLDGGASWLATDMRLDTDLPGTAHSQSQQIAASGDSVYVVWQDSRFSTGGAVFDIHFNRSLDRGATWLPADIQLETDSPGLHNSSSPQIAASGDSVYVTWQEERDGRVDIHFSRSLDSGLSWLTSDIRLDTDLPGAAYSSQPQIAASGDSVYVTWEDTRNGSADIYFNIPFGAQPYGEGTAGSGGITPSLRGTDSLNIGGTFTLTIGDGLGGAFGLLTLGAYQSNLSPIVVGGPQLINPIDLLVPVLLDGTPGIPGEGSYSIEIPIPVDNALFGFNVNLQALFVDPSAEHGIAWTNAVEAWIL
jgi:hypothetical protein